MSDRIAVSKRLAGSMGADESSDTLVTFTMNGSLDMGNVGACTVSRRAAGFNHETQFML